MVHSAATGEQDGTAPQRTASDRVGVLVSPGDVDLRGTARERTLGNGHGRAGATVARKASGLAGASSCLQHFVADCGLAPECEDVHRGQRRDGVGDLGGHLTARGDQQDGAIGQRTCGQRVG